MMDAKECLLKIHTSNYLHSEGKISLIELDRQLSEILESYHQHKLNEVTVEDIFQFLVDSERRLSEKEEFYKLEAERISQAIRDLYNTKTD